MKISIIGLGYIGIPLAVLSAQSGHEVHGFDINQQVIDNFNKGISKINEEDFSHLLTLTLRSGNLIAKNYIQSSDVYVVTVPTPVNIDNTPNLADVYKSIDMIIPVLDRDQLIIIESTVPVGTTENLASHIISARPDLYCDINKQNFSLAYCPERILPGNILHELKQNDRIIGGVTPSCTTKAITFYMEFLDVKLHGTDSKTAEFVKLSENSFRDLNIAFANDLSMLSQEWDIDVFEAIELANKHPRVNILKPSAGVGGHCLAVDPLFLISNASQNGDTIRAARRVNDKKPEFILEQVHELAKRCEPMEFCELHIAILGITYKPDSNDLRNSPALAIAEKISQFGFKHISIAEPNLDLLPDTLNQSNIFLNSAEHCLKDAHIAIILVPHTEFFEIKASSFKNLVILDPVNLLKNLNSY